MSYYITIFLHHAKSESADILPYLTAVSSLPSALVIWTKTQKGKLTTGEDP